MPPSPRPLVFQRPLSFLLQGELKIVNDAHCSSALDEDDRLSSYRRRRYESLLLEHYKYEEILIDQKYNRVLRKRPSRKRLDREYKKRDTDTSLKSRRTRPDCGYKNRDSSLKAEPLQSLSTELAVINYESDENGPQLNVELKGHLTHSMVNGNEVPSEVINEIERNNEVYDGNQKNVPKDVKKINEKQRTNTNQIFISKENFVPKNNETLTKILNEAKISDHKATPKPSAGNVRPLLSNNDIDAFFKKQISEYNNKIKSLLTEEPPKDHVLEKEDTDFKVVFERIKEMQLKNDNSTESIDARLDSKAQYHAQLTRALQSYYGISKKNLSTVKQLKNGHLLRFKTFQNQIESTHNRLSKTDTDCMDDNIETRNSGYFASRYNALLKAVGEDFHEGGSEAKESPVVQGDSGAKKAASDPLTMTKEFKFLNTQLKQHSMQDPGEKTRYKLNDTIVNDSTRESGFVKNGPRFSDVFMEKYEQFVSENDNQNLFKTIILDIPETFKNTIDVKNSNHNKRNKTVESIEEEKATKEKSKISRGITKMFVKSKTVKSKRFTLPSKVKPTVVVLKNKKRTPFWKSERKRSERKVCS